MRRRRKSKHHQRFSKTPSGRWESELRRSGFPFVAGVDEVGRGCLAGPVVAAAVILRPGARIPGLRDSKLLSPQQRRSLVPLILRGSLAWAVGAVSPFGIDRWNIRRASFRAMCLAIERLKRVPSHVLVDGFSIPNLALPQTGLVGADRRIRCVAAASVLAKVARDRRMDLYDRRYSGYLFDRNRGYPTAEHLAALEKLGPSPIHRKSFSPVARLLHRPARLAL